VPWRCPVELTQRIRRRRRGVLVQLVDFFETLLHASAQSLPPHAATAPTPDAPLERPGPVNTVPELLNDKSRTLGTARVHTTAAPDASASDALFETLSSALAAWQQGACAHGTVRATPQRAGERSAPRRGAHARDCPRPSCLSILTRRR